MKQTITARCTCLKTAWSVLRGREHYHQCITLSGEDQARLGRFLLAKQLQAFTRDDLTVIAARRKGILKKLQMLSDARSSRMPDNPSKAHTLDGTHPSHASKSPPVTSKGYAESSFPPGFDADCLEKDGPPPKDFSLYAHYRWRFDRAEQDAKRAGSGDDWTRAILYIDSLCSMAMRDHMLYIGAIRRPQGQEDAEERGKRLITEYRGVPANEVATWEMCSPVWIRTERRLRGWEPEYGMERESDARLLRIIELKKQGKTQREIAKAIGCSAMTVNRALAA